MKSILSVCLDIYGHPRNVIHVDLEKECPELLQPIRSTDCIFMAMANCETFSESTQLHDERERRRKAAEYIAKTVAEHLISGIEVNDTHNGYKSHE